MKGQRAAGGILSRARKISRILIAVVIAVASFSFLQTNAKGVYTDIQGHWAEAEIIRWSKLGIIQGSDNNFYPDKPMTRGEVAVILDRLMKYQTEAPNNFTDVGRAYYTSALLKANAAGIIKGDNGRLRPEDVMTREEAAVLFTRLFGLDKTAPAPATYSDADQISKWARDAVNTLGYFGYMIGCDGSFNPKGAITRGELAHILNITVILCNSTDVFSKDMPGILVVNTPGATVKDSKIIGNLIIAEGVGNGEVTLYNVTVTGKLIVRGGGANSIHIEGNSQISSIVN